jgi:hypothetical protein
MPVRCVRRCCMLVGSCCSRGASNAAGVEFWRRWSVRRRWMPEGAFVDSILYARRVRVLLSEEMVVLWSESALNRQSHAQC